MRYSNRFTLKDRLGEKRVRRKFLLMPRSFRTGESRWLEWADVVEEILEIDVGGSMEWGEYAYRWREVGFADTNISGQRS